MSGLSQLLQTGLSGLTAATEAMETVANNTANASTPGYNVQSINQVELAGSAGSPGAGAEVTSIVRGFDQFLFRQGVAAASANAAAQVVQTQTQALAGLFPVASGGAGGLGSVLDSFFAAANQVAQDPANAANREAFLGQAQSLAAAFGSVGGSIADSIAGLDSEIGTTVQQINQLTGQIAQLNDAIAAQANGVGGAPNALLDQRDALVQQLSQQIGITTAPQANGVVDVFTAGGAALVNAGTAYELAIGSGEYGDGEKTVTYDPTGQDLTQSLSSGQIGGLLTARGQLTDAQNALGALAAGVSAAVNTQQSLGRDLNGNLGQPLLSVASPTVYAAQNNAGNGVLTASISAAALFSPGDFILTKTAGGFEAVDATTGQATALGSGPLLSYDGVAITVSGAPQIGDSFKIEPTASAAQSLAVATTDPSAIAAAAPYKATHGNNAGNVQARIGNPISIAALPSGTVLIPASAFGQQLSIQFTSSTAFNVVSSSNSIIASGTLSPTSGAEIAIAYPASGGAAGEAVPITLSLGTAVTGDSFMLTSGGSGSNDNIVALAGLANQEVLSGQTLDGFYGALVSRIGSRGQQAQLAAQTAQAIVQQTQATQQSVSGVNLDQQAANLVAYQQAYQAAAKVIATAQTLFQSLLNAV